MFDFNSVGGSCFCFSFKMGKSQSVFSFQVCSSGSEAHEAVSSTGDDKCSRVGKVQSLTIKSLLFIITSLQSDFQGNKKPLLTVIVFLCVLD